MESLIKQLYKLSPQLMRELWTELVIGESPAYRWCLKTLAWIRPSRLWFSKKTESRMELWDSLMLRNLWEDKINLQRRPRRSYKWHHKPHTFPLHAWHKFFFSISFPLHPFPASKCKWWKNNTSKSPICKLHE